jgi:hypothetical protein
MGTILTDMGDYHQALRYGLLAVPTGESLKDSTLLMCSIYNRLGLSYMSFKLIGFLSKLNRLLLLSITSISPDVHFTNSICPEFFLRECSIYSGLIRDEMFLFRN